MSLTRGALVSDILRRMGDPDGTIWSRAEVVVHVQNGYQQIATDQRVFFDWAYLENLPRGFSYTQPWEKAFLDDMGGFDFGQANYTAAFEAGLLDERRQSGPANHTSPFEYTDGFMTAQGADISISATAELPRSITSLQRVVWDRRGLDALSPKLMKYADSRFEITKGEVYAFMWQKDGVRTLRKIRVPAQVCSVVTTSKKNWGIVRSIADVSTDTTVTGTWGIPRRIPGHHAFGSESFGTPRRFFLDTFNVRAEIYRTGRPLEDDDTVCELPTRYAKYLRDYAQARLFGRKGPGMDLKLSAHFDQRWTRGLTRIANRIDRVDKDRVLVLGGDGSALMTRPPRPKLPWQYGEVVR